MDADIADGIALLKAIGIFKFRMDDEARLAEDFSMGQGQDDKGKDEDADDGDQADLRFCTPLQRLSPSFFWKTPAVDKALHFLIICTGKGLFIGNEPEMPVL